MNLYTDSSSLNGMNPDPTQESREQLTTRDLRVRTLSGSRRMKNGLATGLILVTLLGAFIPLGFVLYYVVTRGLQPILANFPGFLTENIADVSFELPAGIEIPDLQDGVGPAIVGTLVTTLSASAISIPLGLLAAIYLNEYGKEGPISRLLRFLSDVMAGVPSIVMGLFIFTIFTINGGGLNATGGALALACLMLPIIIRSAETVLKLVPDDLRQASYALGGSKSRTILTVVLPASLSGLTSGALLAVARAAGETAPLLFTIGTTVTYNPSLGGQNISLATMIFANARSAYPKAVERGWGAALTLIVLVVVLSVMARIVASRFTVKAN